MIKKLIPSSIRRRVKFALKRLRYSGVGRTCPICGGQSRVFSDFGYTLRHDAQCIWCGSLERHRLVWLYLQKKLNFTKYGAESRFLHIAPEECLEPKLRRAFPGKYLTADLFDEKVDMKMDISQIGFPDQTFDFIYCSHVLEHVPDDNKAMREFYRVLTDQGTAVIMVPITAAETFEDLSITDPNERLRIFGQKDHVRRYGPDFEDRLRNAGFAVTRVIGKDFLSAKEIEEMGVSDAAGDFIFECRRK